ncbi:hypothetical protein [uncultured Methylibium sp.]|uniref:hypothetical protein n=1 Tax=uncultured Methylibium sp. TaxID=381093 RepID=UPI0025DE378A|nr:hypothetical protein [uncultured Methylibium sp.]
MQCPSCQSSDTLKCEAAYEQGKSTATVRANDGTTGTVTTVSSFAQRAAPPSPWLKETGGTAAAVGVAYLVIDGISAMRGSTALAVLGWITVAFGLLFVWRLVALPKYFRKHSEWERQWICRRCNKVFGP